jgi:hypothetical protein
MSPLGGVQGLAGVRRQFKCSLMERKQPARQPHEYLGVCSSTDVGYLNTNQLKILTMSKHLQSIFSHPPKSV